MISAGLCSITFRGLPAGEIIALAAGNGLSAIEWGGDIHVPAGRPGIAAEVGRRTLEAGLLTPSYGSYFRVTPRSVTSDFAPTLETARALGARTIRVWADAKPSREMDAGYFGALADAGEMLSEAAAEAGCEVGFEYHLGTATDTDESALHLIEAIGHPAARLYWQPRQKTSGADRLAGLRRILGCLAHLHVFHWIGDGDARQPLAGGAADWRSYLAAAAEAPGDRCAYLEFVPGDSVEAFVRDAATLRDLLAACTAVSEKK
jgi:3-dehydroshikimate dehydratase